MELADQTAALLIATENDRRKSKSYLSNEELLQELDLYQETKIISEKLGKMFQLLARKVANRPNFFNYTFRRDMISEGVLTCINYIDNFNPKKSKNPFSYFTTVIFHSMVNMINKEATQSNIRERLRFLSSNGNVRTPSKRTKYHDENL